MIRYCFFAVMSMFLMTLCADTRFLYELLPITGGHVQVTSGGKNNMDPDAFLGAKAGQETLVDCVADVSLAISFDEPTDMRRLAIFGCGWGDWASPSKVAISVNGGDELVYNLIGDRTAPDQNPNLFPADVVVLPEEASATRQMTLRVLDVNTGGNRHGAFKLARPGKAAAVLPIDFHDYYPSDALNIDITTECAQSNLVVHASAYWFCQDLMFDAVLPDMSAGTHRFTIPWASFICRENPDYVFESTFLREISLELPENCLVSPIVSVSPHLAAARKPSFWNKVDTIDFTEDADGWRQGIPSNGFGRFGFHPDNGLLSFNYDCEHDKLEFNSWIGGSAAEFTLMFDSGAPRSLRWERIHANSTGTFRYALMPFDGTKRNQVESKAFGVFDQTQIPERQLTSILVPGILNVSADPIFSIFPQSDLGTPWLLLPSENNMLVWKKLTGTENFTKLSEGWICLVFEKQPQIPLLIALEKQPKRLAFDRNGLAMDFGEARGHIAIGTPYGIRVWNGIPGADDDAAAELAGYSRRLAAILRAYPIRSVMTFKDLGDKIHIREKYGYYNWTNAWREQGTAISPLPPMLAYAAECGYPVEFPAGEPDGELLETRYGVYRYWTEGTGFAEYILPVPDVSRKLYPRSESELAACIPDLIMKEVKAVFEPEPPPSWEGSLSNWWMYAAGSQMQAFMTKEQRDKITARWKLAMDYVMDGHAWHLRREPYSGAEYPISFAWVDTGLQVLGDPNSGIGAPLCGADSYAEFSGDWDTIEKYWDAICKIPYYFYYCHDWTMMQTGCREHTADSCIDMDVIAYEGAAAFLRMARTLKKTDDMAAAKLLVARFGVSGVTKWWGPAYGHPGLKPEEYASIGCGYSEFSGYANKLPRHSDPCFINGEIALSFSWCGNFPSWYTLLLNGNGADFWRIFQYDMVENKMYQWRTAHPGHRNWHDANVAAHLYMRLLLGMSDEEIAHELELSDFFKNPYPRMAAENAAFYALLFSHDTPVVLNSFGKAELTEFNWDRETRTVTASFRVPENAADDVVSFDLKAVPVSGPEENVRLVPGIQTIQWLF